ncbi:MAG: glycoside hydrolase family 99-like domain-containing protein [Chloroflexi bacterium]|nr:glycoside hydrolase family 99-like domain-containing protein [Chloroflexota bacterium]MCL5275599.1 glycoside hydrolase family 99-like domain-containing protein [Chloroflexota bacterium]
MQVCVYYFPNYHVDPRNELIHGRGWTEWELVKTARPRFPGHQQPRIPAWGYEDEADPGVFQRKIAAAADHGVSSFIFDWYYYNDGPFLQRGLEQGYLQADNNRRLKFALMWANHDWVDIHPARHNERPRLLYPGAITRATWERMTDYVVTHYFTHPSYWLIDGRPYFSIYELYRLIDGLGGIAQTQQAIASFRAKTRAAGFPDLHLNGVVWGVQVLPQETRLTNPAEIAAAMQLDSISSYVWIHHVPLPQFPLTSYETVKTVAVKSWHELAGRFSKPYYPNVTMGWDSSPRTYQDGPYGNYGYPYMPSLCGNTPAAFKQALLDARTFLSSRPDNQQILSINAWNEWTEGSYLEPDTVNGMAYLEAIRDVFGD